MKNRIVSIAARLFLLSVIGFLGTAFLGTGCGDDCPGNEVCGAFDCVCLVEPCRVNGDCPQGLVCDEGICAD